jgi:hypothetical protein
MGRLLLAFLLFTAVGASGAVPDTLANYDIHGGAHMFMCPFLTPKFMDEVRQECQCDVTKSEDLVIHVRKSAPLNEEKLLQKAEEIGYERKNITIQRID